MHGMSEKGKMSWNVGFGSGRATCRICNKIIKGDELQVKVTAGGGYNTIERSVHLDCLVALGDDAVVKRG